MRTMISAAEARELVLARAVLREPVTLPAGDAAGLVLARDVLADRDFPPFDRSTMDGFAVRCAHAGRTVAVRGEARPGVAPSLGPTDEGCIEIMTGAPCPPGTQAVVMKEQVERDGGRATFPARIVAGQNIVRRATECPRGAVVLLAGAPLNAIAVALLASVGGGTVSVRPLPSLAILVTGDELVQGGRPSEVEIRDSNGPMLTAMAASIGVTRPNLLHVHDTLPSLAAALDAVASSDVVVLTGGVSAGNYDLVPAALAAHGATLIFHKVRQQPGKPLLLAEKGRRQFFGLPGTPLGCHLGFWRYVLPAMRAMAGLPPVRPPDSGHLTAAWSSPSDREQFVLAKVTRQGGAWAVTPLVARGSSDLFTVHAANAYMPVPEGTRALEAGAEVAVEWLSEAP